MKYLPLLLLALGCGGRGAGSQGPQPLTVPIEALEADSIATVFLERAFRADEALQNPDSLYIQDAEIIANGEPRADAPRIAGVDSGGKLQIGSSRIEATGSFVWGTADYRWVPNAPERAGAEGRATIVIVRRRTGGWRIVHLHSSTTPPPEKPRPTPPDTSGGAGQVIQR